MKIRLDQLTIGQFIDIICGERECIGDTEQSLTIRNLIMEFKSIVDPSGLRVYLSNLEEIGKAKLSILTYQICENLMNLHQYDDVRKILNECGLSASTMPESRLAAEVKSRIERAKNTLVKIEEEMNEEKAEDVDIRKEFDSQTAALMAYFKFQIDIDTMSASIYAHLVARHNREIKAQLATMKK